MMTNDSDRRTADRTVSATYRDLADERTPADLDEKILRHAATPPRTRFGGGSAWMKPVAWAATIGLSLAIVLELTQVPPAIDTVAPPPADEHPIAAPVSIEPATAKESRSDKPSGHRSEPGAVQNSWAPTMAPAAAKGQADTPEQEPMRPQELESTDERLVDDGDATANTRGDGAAGTAAYAIRAGDMMPEQPALCPETVRTIAEDWYECIEAQRHKVSTQRVAQEFEEFRARFPDFQPSDTE